MKNIILQHFTGELRELDKLSINNIRNYAKRIGAEYRFIEGQVFRPHLTAPCQKVYMLDEIFDEYDTVLMLDIDMFTPAGMEENIFDVQGIGLHAPIQGKLHQKLVRNYPKISSLNYPYWGGAIYKMDREARKQLRSGLGGDEVWMENYNELYRFEDEGIIHTLAVKTKYNPDVPYFNGNKWCYCSFLPNPQGAGFIHIRTKITPTGPKRTKIENYNALVQRGIIDV